MLRVKIDKLLELDEVEMKLCFTKKERNKTWIEFFFGSEEWK